MAKTGQPRKTKQPLKIDRLPPSVHDAIRYLRTELGLVWEEIEARSTLQYSKAWQVDCGGFVDWVNLPVDLLELFPEKKLGHSLLHRWWDIRVEQVSANVMNLSTQARAIAKVFAKSAVKGEKEAVQNAARDILLGILAEDGTVMGRKSIAGGLIKLAEVQIKASTNKIRERKVAVDEQNLQMKLDEIKRKAGELLKDAEAGTTDAPAMTREQVIARVKEIYGVA